MNALRLSPFQHFVSFAGAVIIAASLFAGAATAQPRSNGPTYRAELVQPAASARIAASGVVWSCEGNSCTAQQSASRPAIVCARLVREAGPVTSFAAGDGALSAEALARCNASAN